MGQEPPGGWRQPVTPRHPQGGTDPPDGPTEDPLVEEIHEVEVFPPKSEDAGPGRGVGEPARPVGWERRQAYAGPELASWWRRVIAFLFDVLVIVVPALLILSGLGVGAVATVLAGDLNVGFLAFVGALILTLVTVLVIGFVYYPLLMSRGGRHNGQTLGKQLLGIRAVRNNGRAFNFGAGVIREIVVKGLLLGTAATVVPLLPYLLNYLWPLWDDENRAIHDMVATTHVIRV